MTKTPSPETRPELRELLERSTSGPWVATERSGYHELLAPDATCDWYGREKMHAVAYIDTELDEAEQEANAALIVAAINALPALLTERDQLRAENARMREALELWVSEFDPAAYVEKDLPDRKYVTAARVTHSALTQAGERV